MSEEGLRARITELEGQVGELETHAELGWAEAKRVSAKLAEAGVEDDGAAVRVLPADRMQQIDDSKPVMRAFKELICPGGTLEQPPPCAIEAGNGCGVGLPAEAYAEARQALARYEKAWGFFGTSALSGEARPVH